QLPVLRQILAVLPPGSGSVKVVFWPSVAVFTVPVLLVTAPSLRMRLPATLLPPTVTDAPCTVSVPLNVGLATVLIEPQVPPVPKVMLVPPPVKLPVPLGQVKV